MSFGSDMTSEQLEALRERYQPTQSAPSEGVRCLHKACSEGGGSGVRKNGMIVPTGSHALVLIAGLCTE